MKFWSKFSYILPRRLVYRIKFNQYCSNSWDTPSKPPWKVLFFGTDQFSLYTLEALNQEYRIGSLINRLEVVTTIKGNKNNPVKQFSDRVKLQLHKWPVNDLNYGVYDIGLVVSFGHLIPEDLINKFRFGMLNVHASLLPRWRGAAPIIYALANGDRTTGVTIMRIKPKHFDIGDIISQSTITIDNTMKLPELHEKLGKLGAKELIKTLNNLPQCLDKAIQQPSTGVTLAPKIDQNFARINWTTMLSQQIYNLDRALMSIYHLTTTFKRINVKLVDIEVDENVENLENFPNRKAGFIFYDKTSQCLKVLCKDSRFIKIKKIGVPGKKLMSAKDFYNGYLSKELITDRYFK